MSPARGFRRTASSAKEARHLVADALDAEPPDFRDAVALLVSELATNALRHGGSGFSVELVTSPTSDQVRVEVTDSGPGEPALRAPLPTEPEGRGLQIVDALALDWGVLAGSRRGGKTVWFTMALPTPAPPFAGDPEGAGL